jgi:hypothetical protein
VAKDETRVGTPGEQPGAIAAAPVAGIAKGVPPAEPTTEFDFATIPAEAWKSEAWYKHAAEAVNLDRFPQFGKFKSESQKREAALQRQLQELQQQVSQAEQLLEFQELEGLAPAEREKYELQKLREERQKTVQQQQIEAALDAEWERVLDDRDRLARVLGIEDADRLEVNVELFYQDPNQAIGDLERQAKEIAEEIGMPASRPPLVESHAGGAPAGGLIEEVRAKPSKERQRVYASDKQFKRLFKEAGTRK